MAKYPLQIDGPKKAKTTVFLAHGAGESSQSSFLKYFAEQLAERHHRVVRFDFPYMMQRSIDGRKRPPDKESALREAWLEVIQQVGVERYVIGGKSMGGRIASLLVDETNAKGLVCLGYPFHPSGRPEKLRVDHLQTITKPTLIVQGEDDPFGSREEVESLSLSSAVQIHWVQEGDHSYHVNRGSTRTHDQNLKNAMRAVEKFLFECFNEEVPAPVVEAVSEPEESGPVHLVSEPIDPEVTELNDTRLDNSELDNTAQDKVQEEAGAESTQWDDDEPED